MSPGRTCAVCLTFDFDAVSAWTGGFGVSTPGFTSRGEFGARVGIWRVLELLDSYQLKSTFFVPGQTADTWPEIVKEIQRRGHEISHHGYAHENPAKLKKEEEKRVLLKGIRSIEAATGQKPLGYRSPAWDTSPNTIEHLLDNGFVYDSSLMADDFKPYRVRVGDKYPLRGPAKFGRQTKLLELPPSWYLDDFPAFEFIWHPVLLNGLRSPSAVYETWQSTFDYMCANVPGGVYTLTMHPQVIGRAHLIAMLERLIKHITSRRDIWIARCAEIVESYTD
jgi:peptidoglycan/xylan/chitin deacetylase (PgdA/CDA1 family)